MKLIKIFLILSFQMVLISVLPTSPPPDPPSTLAILGDSITENSGTWPARFETGNEAVTAFYNDQRGAIGWALNRPRPLSSSETPAPTAIPLRLILARLPGWNLVLGGTNDAAAMT
ncbi:MAG: hypothetical protein IPI16_16375 [Comamonadaceae bacterium]|nr:hypothetical protein [Comamonadaceae bacterium]